MDRRATLLVVEDEAVLRSLVCHFLRNEGYEVHEAENGEEGVRVFQNEGPFDLILLDLNLPVFSGVEVSRQVKLAQPSQRILILSAAILGENEASLLKLGVRHFLTKPYHPEQLLAHIRLELSGAFDRATFVQESGHRQANGLN